MSALLLLWGMLLTPQALADEASCMRCCAAAGETDCSARLRVVGEDSIVVARSSGDFQVVGLWVLPCEGNAFFDVGETARFSDAPVTGEVATEGSSPKALRCFTEACALPAGTCPEAINGSPVLRQCEGGGPVSDADLARPTGAAPSGAGVTTVMVGGKAVMAVKTNSTAAPAATAQPSAAQPNAAQPNAQAPAGYAVQPSRAPVSPPAPVYGQAPAGQSGQAPAPAAVSTQVSAPQPGAPPPRAAADVSAPPPPKGPCSTPAALIQESGRHVDLGNDAEIARDAQTAADEYRAAITMDACNAFAWASLGSLALREGQPGHAASALRVAVRLKPEHYGAATDLGRAYERLGETQRAVDAYRAALEARAGHPPAAEGLSRLGAAPR